MISGSLLYYFCQYFEEFQQSVEANLKINVKLKYCFKLKRFTIFQQTACDVGIYNIRDRHCPWQVNMWRGYSDKKTSTSFYPTCIAATWVGGFRYDLWIVKVSEISITMTVYGLASTITKNQVMLSEIIKKFVFIVWD